MSKRIGRGEAVTCNYCGRRAERVTGADVYAGRADLADKFFYRCRPCDARVGCHPGTDRPLGALATRELRRMRIVVHDVFDRLWQSKQMTRGQAYAWLRAELGLGPDECHIGMFDERRCAMALDAVKSGRWQKVEVADAG